MNGRHGLRCNGRGATSIATAERLCVSLPSEPGRLVDLITERAPSGEGAAVVGHDFESALVEIWPVSRHVRCEQHVGQCPKRVLARQRLQLIDVERSASNLAGLQR